MVLTARRREVPEPQIRGAPERLSAPNSTEELLLWYVVNEPYYKDVMDPLVTVEQV